MYNYEHQVKIIKDKHLKQYIYYDYFHDSPIKNIDINNSNNTVSIILSCEREWPDNDIDKYLNDENFEYTLRFEKCEHFEYRKSANLYMDTFLNSRFKASALLEEINITTKRSNYHLRIQTTFGYIDIIFRTFHLQKRSGIVNTISRIPLKHYYDFIESKFQDFTILELNKIALEDNFPINQYAMEYLWLKKGQEVLNIARKNLDNEDTQIAAIAIIGDIGELKDITYLNKIRRNFVDNLIMLKHIDDSISKIIRRY